MDLNTDNTVHNDHKWHDSQSPEVIFNEFSWQEQHTWQH